MLALRTSRALFLQGDCGDALGVGVEARFEAIHFHDEHRAGVEREAEVKRRLDRLQDQLVEHFQGGGNDAGADDVADGVGGVVDRLEDAEQRAIRLGIAGDAHPDLRGDAEGSLGADDDAGQVVAGIVLGRAAGLDDPAIGQHEFEAEDVIDGDAVLERVRAAGIGGDVAADGAGPLARRIGGEVVAVRLEVVGEPEVDDARLDDGDSDCGSRLRESASSAPGRS